ncbi:MAG: hypothetical protein ABSF70_17060 [Terracidiphilus sp.]|jgi:hypothetical protein
MDETAFCQYYDHLTDDQLAAILEDKRDLVPEAAAALDAEVQRRNVTLPEPIKWARQSGLDENVKSLEDYSDYQQLVGRQKSVGRYWYFVAMGPIILLLVLARKALENATFVILALGWAVCVAGYVFSLTSRVLAYKCPQCSHVFGLGAECNFCGFPRSSK